MSQHFSANQYEKEFDSKRLQNWEDPKISQERPRSLQGFTEIIANDRGHIVYDPKRSKGNPWGDHVGTWDMPIKIPGQRGMNATARSADAQRIQYAIRREGDETLSGWNKNMKPKASGQGKTIAERVLGIDESDMYHTDIDRMHPQRTVQEPISMPDKGTQYTKTDVLKTPSPQPECGRQISPLGSPSDVKPMQAHPGPSPQEMMERQTPIKMS
ncbi:unnamed protein product [Owenia fusiformis]|uniref:Cilia- and flagella-associated protein 126 n=1 Tax=Owenia fusiformis TaxID=6347 RepID=A0A8J1U179_OWEFU|nr:unnamed protein product [Owenia fusiformis]